MTKQTLAAFLLQYRCTSSYSGHNHTLYVNTYSTNATSNDIQTLIIQNFGITPDFEIRKQE